MPPAMRWSNHRLLDRHRTLLLPCHCRTFFRRGTGLVLRYCECIEVFTDPPPALCCLQLLPSLGLTRLASSVCGGGGGLTVMATTDPVFLSNTGSSVEKRDHQCLWPLACWPLALAPRRARHLSSDYLLTARSDSRLAVWTIN